MNQTIHRPHSQLTHFGLSFLAALVLHTLVVVGFFRFEHRAETSKGQFVGSLTGVTINSLDAIDVKGIHGDGTGLEVGKSGKILETFGYTVTNYPAQNGQEGEVVLQMKVSPEGIPQELRIKKSSGNKNLDQAALEAISDWRFHQRRSSDFISVEKKIVFKIIP